MTQPTSELEQRPQIPWPVFFVTVAGAFVVALDLSIVNVAFPSIEASFPDVSTTALSWVLSAYSVVFGALLLGAGGSPTGRADGAGSCGAWPCSPWARCSAAWPPARGC